MLGHQKRVLYLASNPVGDTVVTGSADSTIKFWRPYKNMKFGNNSQLDGVYLRWINILFNVSIVLMFITIYKLI